MANVLRIKRRVNGLSGAPSSLKNAELAFSEVDDILYYGKGVDGNGDATTIPAIAGAGAFVSLTGNQTITGTKTVNGTLTLSGATIDGFTTTGNITVGGDLTVNGSLTSISSTTLEVEDKNIELGKVVSPSDITADGGGITLLGDSNKTFNWVNATDAWTSSEHLNLASGKNYYINGANVLSATTLGSGVTVSSLTTVGTIASGVWSASTIAVDKGGTGVTTISGIVKGNGTSAFSAAVAGVDYLSPTAEIDGGTY